MAVKTTLVKQDHARPFTQVTHSKYFMPRVIKYLKNGAKLMGLKPMGTASEPKQRCGYSSRVTSGLTLMPFRASANAGCTEPHHMHGHWTCRKCPQELKAVYGDGWMDG